MDWATQIFFINRIMLRLFSMANSCERAADASWAVRCEVLAIIRQGLALMPLHGMAQQIGAPPSVTLLFARIAAAAASPGDGYDADRPRPDGDFALAEDPDGMPPHDDYGCGCGDGSDGDTPDDARRLALHVRALAFALAALLAWLERNASRQARIEYGPQARTLAGGPCAQPALLRAAPAPALIDTS